MGLEVNQAPMMTFARAYAPFWRFNITCIHYLLEKAGDRHGTDRVVLLVVFGKVRIALQKALHFRLRAKMPRGIAFKGLTHDRSKDFIWHQYLAPA